MDSAVMPQMFYGSLTVNGQPAAIGTEMRAADQDGNDITYVPYLTTESGWYGGRSAFDIRLQVGKPIVGDIIHFLIELSSGSGLFAYADQTYEFQSGDITELGLTATGEVPQEGQAAIVSVDSPQEAQSGANIAISTNVRNDGGNDILFATLKDDDTNEIIGARTPMNMESGSQYTFTWDSTMPNKRLNILLEAGHEE